MRSLVPQHEPRHQIVNLANGRCKPAGYSRGTGGSRPPLAPRRAFTLIELLVAIGILLVISALTFSMVNVTMDSDRIRSGSREIQSYLEGARNQAIYARQPRGVRFLLNPDDPSTVNSMLYIGPPSRFSGTISVTNLNPMFGAVPPEWANLTARGLLVDGARIRIPSSGGEWYTIAQNGANNWELTKPYLGGTATESYDLELAPAVLPNQEPRLLPRGTVIDLDNSVLPVSWITAPGPPPTYSNQMDVLFSPRGTVIGEVGATGRVHFVLSDTNDTNLDITGSGNNSTTWSSAPTISRRDYLNTPWRDANDYVVGNWVVPEPGSNLAFQCIGGGMSGGAQPAGFATAQPGDTIPGDGGVTWQCFAKNRNLIVTLVTNTGNVASYPVFQTVLATPPALPPWHDSFRYAETGEVAK